MSWSGAIILGRGDGSLDERSIGVTAGVESLLCGPGTRFQAGSISKQVMSLAVLQLAECGTVELDQSIDRWLPDLPPRFEPITLRQLLSQTSGIGHWSAISGMPPVLENPPRREALLAMIFDAPLVSAPGRRWGYSSPAFLVVASIIEAVTGDSYADVVTSLVLKPAGMRNSTSGQFPIGDLDVAVGHHDGHELVVNPNFTDLPGTGDLWTTASDLLRYSRALRRGELVDLSTASKLWTEHARMDEPEPIDRPLVASSYGYGTFLGRVLGHVAWYVPGDNPGYESLLAYLPTTDTDLVVLSNQNAGIGRALEQLTLPT